MGEQFQMRTCLDSHLERPAPVNLYVFYRRKFSLYIGNLKKQPSPSGPLIGRRSASKKVWGAAARRRFVPWSPKNRRVSNLIYKRLASQ